MAGDMHSYDRPDLHELIIIGSGPAGYTAAWSLRPAIAPICPEPGH
jgi:hypothetical protein